VLFKEGSFVVQKYIERPLLIRERKFDIRQWVLVHELYPTRIWFYGECYVRFSAETYSTNIQNRFAHLTNNSIAKNSSAFMKSEIKGNMWT
jgi:tubulin monoglycylase TTLL3/8